MANISGATETLIAGGERTERGCIQNPGEGDERRARTLFEQQGFALIEAGDDGSRRYRLEAGASETLECPGIAVQSMEND